MIIDIGGEKYARTYEISDPGVLSNDDLIRADLSCASPYDIDDNPEDDTAQTYYKATKSGIIESSELIYGVLTTTIILGVAYFTGLLSTGKPKQKKTVKQEKTVSETVDEPEQPIDEALPKEIDDFSIEFAEDNALEVIEILGDDEIDEEIIDIDDSSASGRLASLRDEIMTDEQPRDTRPLSDRMADFFKD